MLRDRKSNRWVLTLGFSTADNKDVQPDVEKMGQRGKDCIILHSFSKQRIDLFLKKSMKQCFRVKGSADNVLCSIIQVKAVKKSHYLSTEAEEGTQMP